MELLHRRCCGLDVHKETVVACLRLVSDGKVTTEVRTFQTTTADLLRLSEWLAANECTHVAMEATGVYWKPVWHILDDGEFALVLANAAQPITRASTTPQNIQPTLVIRPPEACV
jgi:transposase